MLTVNCENWDCSVQIYRQAEKGECPTIVERLMAIAQSLNNESRAAQKAEKLEWQKAEAARMLGKLETLPA